MRDPSPTAVAVATDRFRRLKWDEMVRRGDFVEDGRQGFEPWEGPSGFHAGSFVKTIYRRLATRSVISKKIS
jgi:hypothetical protein